MSPALAEAERAPLGDANNMERMLAELGGGDLLQAIKSLEGELLSGAESTCGANVLEAEGERLRRRAELLTRRARTLAARAIGARVARSASTVLAEAGDGSICTVLARARARAALPRKRALPPRISDPETAEEASALQSHLTVVASALDSDATASSSGGESDDELVSYDNSNQLPLSIENRALWKYLKMRAWIGSRWTWLSAQLQELDYKIRQHTDLLRQVKTAQSRREYSEDVEGCARTRPVQLSSKPKIHHMQGLHNTVNRPSDIRCSCSWPVVCCPVCTGGAKLETPTPRAALTSRERALYLDPAWHRALSHTKELSPSLYLSARACSGAWPVRSSSTQQQTTSLPLSCTSSNPPQHVPTHSKAKRGRPPTVKRRDTYTNEKIRNRTASYDIDNIVIPQSVAASTRLEVLHYKEIITPEMKSRQDFFRKRWRVCDPPEPLTNGIVKSSTTKGIPEEDSDEEDTSDAAVIERHTRALIAERLHFQRNKQNSKGNSSKAHFNDEEGLDESPYQPKASYL